MEKITISKLAKKTEVNIQTVRYYERRGLIPEPQRTESGYRQYSYDTVLRIRFIKRAQKLGFSLKEISELLSLRVDKNTTCGDFKNIAEVKISEVEKKIRSLNGIKKALTKLVALCSGEGPTSECPIVETLDTD
ncbi:MAG: Hg(II)-responsive transcriptional regulator [Candidatus Dadabacteria bacterium]|nr:Hg(II)-responsive transcriptional regulator [Candidatus Dadabacteria bacterium]